MNRHPIDRLADIRQQIGELQDEADMIRAGVLAGQIDRIGEEYQADVSEHPYRSILLADAERVLPPELFNEVVSSKTTTQLRLRARK